MNDILPAQSPTWQYLESKLRNLMAAYIYREIRMPIVEPSSLFSRGIGAGTDIIEKEMYSFQDRNGEGLSLRPEGTAGCVRAGIQHGIYNQTQRLWTMGAMFRYERPQKGRYRQFHQFSVETFGMAGPDIDAELILLTARLWKELDILKYLRLELNTLGTLEARKNYRTALVEYFNKFIENIDEDSRKRLRINPLRILDSKDDKTQKIVAAAPALHNFLDEKSIEHFNNLKKILDAAGISYVINPRLVRGLDYYSKTVFEWITDSLGAQGTVCGGGRYDALIELLGGKPTPAIGFAIGLERMVLMLETLKLISGSINKTVDVVVISCGEGISGKALPMIEKIRSAIPNLRIQVNFVGGFKGQMKRAFNSGADFAFIIGENELAEQCVSVKSLKTTMEQKKMNITTVINFIEKQIQE